MNIFTVFLWAVAILVGSRILLLMFRIALGRKALRLIESTHITNPKENHHEDIPLSEAPEALRKLFGEHSAEVTRCGFTALLTGRKMLLKAGRTNTHYTVLVSEDRSTLVEFQHARVGRVFPLWPVILPFSEIIGPTVCCFTFETLCSDNTTVITGSGKSLSGLTTPSLRTNIVPDSMPFGERWESHKHSVREWQQGTDRKFVPFDTKESFFEKERIQREQIAADQKLKMTQLREESMADVWDRKPS